jgi:hypothetical protein
LRDRLTSALVALAAIGAILAAPLPALATTPSPKVVIIVGPTGSVTDSYRSQGDQIAAAATADGATVVKVYSPNATWAHVRAAVAGANIIVYLGHGNGYPNPYSTTFMADRDDGWGLNTTTTHGDQDSWSNGTLVYCGEKALLGTLTSGDGANQWHYCGGSTNTDGIAPAAGFVMVYSNACYAPGASEPGTTPATPTQALQRVSYFSRPILSGLGGGGYFATDHGATPLVHAMITNPDAALGDIYVANTPSVITATSQSHLFVTGASAWLGHRGTDPYYTYAFAGNPNRTFAGGTADMTLTPPPPAGDGTDVTPPTLTTRSPGRGKPNISMSTTVTVQFSEAVTGVTGGNFVLRAGSTVVPSTVTYDSGTHAGLLRPNAPLEPSTQYSVALSGRIKDAAGNALAWTTWVFSTRLTDAYSPARTLSFAVGTYTGYKFSSTGTVTASRRYTLTRASNAPTSSRSGVTAHSGGWYLVTAGVWAGYWIHEGTGIALH